MWTLHFSPQLIRNKARSESAGYVVLEARSGSVAVNPFQPQQIDTLVRNYWVSEPLDGTFGPKQRSALLRGAPFRFPFFLKETPDV